VVRNDAHPAMANGYTLPEGAALTSYARGSAVFYQGDHAEHWYVVRDGVLRTCRFRSDGQRQLTGFYFAGDIIGFEADRYLATAEAVTEARLECHGVHGVPIASEKLERALANANRYIVLLGHRTAAERVAAFLISLPRDGHHIALPMSRADIADYLGLTIHTISRTFSDLARRGILSAESRHRLRIDDPQQLARLSGEETEAPVNHQGREPCPNH
jgi:CRP-like cAMP-binding protein